MKQNFSFAVHYGDKVNMVCILSEYKEDAKEFLLLKYPFSKVVFLGVSYSGHNYEID